MTYNAGMVEKEPVLFNGVSAVADSPETRSTSESLESFDQLVQLFRKRRISFEEYYFKMRQHSGLVQLREVHDIRPKREFDIKPTSEEKMHAYNLERELTAEYLTKKITLPQFIFLQDRLVPFTRLNLRAIAAGLDEREARYNREQFVNKIKGLLRIIVS